MNTHFLSRIFDYQKTYDIPAAQLMQVLLWMQTNTQYDDRLLQQFPDFFLQCFSKNKNFDWEHILWNDVFLKKHAQHFKDQYFFKKLPPSVTGMYSDDFVRCHAPDESEYALYLDVILAQNPNSISFLYALPVELLRLWKQKNDAHFFEFLMMQKLYASEHKATSIFDDTQSLITLYHEDLDDRIMLFIQYYVLDGTHSAMSDVKDKMKNFLKQQDIKPWTRKNYEDYIEKHAPFIVDTLLPLVIHTRAKIKKPAVRQMEIWHIIKPHLNKEYLLRYAKRFFSVNMTAQLFENTVLAEQHERFCILHTMGVIHQKDYLDFLEEKIQDPTTIAELDIF